MDRGRIGSGRVVTFSAPGMGVAFTAALASLLALLAGCAVGANDGEPDGSGAATSTDGGASDDATTSADSTVAFSEAGFPTVDGKANGSDAVSIFADAGSPSDAHVDTAPGSGSGSSSSTSSASSSGSGSSSTGASSSSSSSGCPAGTTGPGCTECATGFHLCGATCTANAANVPTSGCATSCGGSCPTVGTESAFCTDAGTCGASCGPGQLLCPGNVCAACCTDADCPTNVMCNGGTCSQCAGSFGTCVTQCDTDFSSTDNCGACGNECDTGFLGGCGLFGVEGESCDNNGGTYSCGC